VQIRKTSHLDILAITLIEEQCFPIHNRLSLFDIRDLYDRTLLWKGWSSSVATKHDKVIAFYFLQIKCNICRIYDIAVDPECRNKGIASKLLENIIFAGKKSNINIFSLEVNEYNVQAIKLYEKFGFKQIKIIPNYYSDSNGIKMRKICPLV